MDPFFQVYPIESIKDIKFNGIVTNKLFNQHNNIRGINLSAMALGVIV